MGSNIISTSSLIGAKVLGGKKGDQRIGKVHCCVFHPSEKRCIGFLIKRPDLLLMFHRPDSFVPLGGFEIEDGAVYLFDEKGISGESACKKMGIKWDDCVLWVGLALCAEDGTLMGRVGSVEFDLESGLVQKVIVDEGATAGALLGRREIPASMVKGFRRGMGAKLSDYSSLAELDDEDDDTQDFQSKRSLALANEASELGALLVSDQAKDLKVAGGLAEKAGKASAVAGNKVKQTVDSAAKAASKTADSAAKAVNSATKTVKPAASQAAAAAGKAVNKGAYATGKQLSRAKGMFGAFRDEFNKARK